ncbi:MAG TPA: hypothetical protein VGM33_22890 [Baekduia sp.]
MAGAQPSPTVFSAAFAARCSGLCPASLAQTGPPADVVAPAITGATGGGSPLTATAGSWSPTGSTYAFQWQRDTGSGYADIGGATTPAYTTVAADVTALLRVRVTATNPLGATTVASPSFGPIAPGTPVNTALPRITGTPRRGQPLAVNAGAWSPAGRTYTYQWQHDAGAGFVDIAGATLSSYTPVASDVGAPLQVTVSATNGFGTVTATTAATAAVLADPPVNHGVPVISGTARRLAVLTTSAGSWTPAGTTYAYQWQRDSGSGFVDIAGATAAGYTLATADVGAIVRVAVKATNPDASATAVSSPTATVAAAVPGSVVAPVVSGTPRRDALLTASTGGWTPAATSFAYQWQRRSATTWADIGGATTSSYTLVAADVGAAIRVEITATNGDGSTVATSQPTAVVTAPPVLSGTVPAPAGTLMDTNLLTAVTGTWAAATNVTYTYQWLRCPPGTTSAATDCISIGLGPTYLLAGPDVGHAIAVRVTASSGSAAAVAVSAPTATIAGRALTGMRTVAITGTAAVSQTVRVVPGQWSVPLIGARYQWQRCAADGTGCVDVAGAGGVVYPITIADAGHALTVREDATSPGRTASATSTPVVVADQPAPVATVAPTISGVAARTNTLMLRPGTWANTSRTSYQWARCDAAGAHCATVAGATGVYYLLTAADIGFTITAAVSATNTSQTVTTYAAPTAVVTKLLPVSRRPPVVVGTLQVPSLVHVDGMAWTATTDTRYTVQWQRCNASGGACADIAGATATTYKLQTADARLTLRVVQTATNPDGAVSATSAPSPVVKPALPAITTPAGILGRPLVGVTVTATPGVWSSATEITTKVLQWWRCKPVCVEIANGGATDYTITSADAGAILRVSETATGPGGTLMLWSPTWIGPVQSSTTGARTFSAGTSGLVRAGGVAVASASVGRVAAAASVARAAAVRKKPAASGSAKAGPVRVTLWRRGPASRLLKAWACVTRPALDDRQPCTKAVALHARTVLKLTVAKGQRVLVVVARRK